MLLPRNSTRIDLLCSNKASIDQVLSRTYEFGDIDFRHTFLNAVDHEVILQARMSGYPQYQDNPLVTNFDVPVTTEGVTLDASAQIIVILVIVALPVVIIILILDFNKRSRRRSSISD